MLVTASTAMLLVACSDGGPRVATSSTSAPQTTRSSSSRSSSSSDDASSTTTEPAPVEGGGPPTGHYVCHNSGAYFGFVDIPRAGTYSVNGGDEGAFLFDSGTSVVTFTSGQFHDYGWDGHWYPAGTNPSLSVDTLAIDEQDLEILCRP
ncbi:MAG: hypothetical protein QOH79_705 [Acidimicrobiaceae bacterium]